jgi:hypothetical protein
MHYCFRDNLMKIILHRDWLIPVNQYIDFHKIFRSTSLLRFVDRAQISEAQLGLRYSEA